MTKVHPVLLASWLLTALLLAACNQTPAAAPGADATIAALATSNAALATQVAELSHALGTPTPIAAGALVVAAPPTAPVTAAVTTPASPLAVAADLGAAGSLLPRLVADVSLAPEDATLNDLRIDAAAGRLYVTDTAGQLHVLDAQSFATLATLPYGGNLELDARNGRLYIYQPNVREGEAPAIHVIDTATLAEVGVLPGGAIAIDAERNRLFVGEPFTYSSTADAPGVRVIDGATLQVLGEIDQPGAPVYNPARNELLIVAYTVYTADPATLQVTGDLFPELTDLDQVGFLWCNGCRWADRAWVLPEVGMVAVDISAHCAGKGCGVEDAPRWFDAATLTPIDSAVAPELQADCGSAVSAVAAVGDRRYHNRLYSRYVVYSNLFVHDLEGGLVTWRDGMRTDFINPHTGQGYLPDGSVLDLATLSPIGRWPAACVLAYDPARGLLYGKRGGSLYVIDERGGAPPASEPPIATALPAAWISALYVSPDFAADNTVLVVSNGALFRSTDGGATWQQLRGGLPAEGSQLLTAHFSPNYAADRTLYVAGFRTDDWGIGVWRSTDGGDTWAPLWQNLQHLRVEALALSPTFAQDQTLVARSKFFDLASQVSGASLHQSTDGGLSWTLVVTGSDGATAGAPPLPPISELLPGAVGVTAAQVRQDFAENQVLLALDGVTWVTTTLTTPPGELLLGVWPAPDYPADPTLYVVSPATIWRTTDAGATWAQWDDARFADPADFDHKLRAAAVTPLLADGGYRLFVGTGTGEVIALDPATLGWTPLAGASASAVAAGATADAGLPTPTPAPLTGEPPAGFHRPAGDLALRWESDARVQQALGWATAAEPTSSPAALQRFDNGVMLWVQATGRIYAFLHDGRWFSYVDEFREGDPESDPAFSPPPGREQPLRGFGKVWREHADLRAAIGWALAKEEPATATYLPFAHGAALRVGVFLYTMVGEEQGDWE